MLSCLFCKRKKRLFKIYVIYGETACPIKDYILQFFGPVEKYLNEDQGICKTCVFVLNNLLYIKNFMYQALIPITDDACQIQPELAFACMFRIFRHNLKKVDYDKSKSGQSSPDLFPYTKSPDSELVESNVQSVDDDFEVQSNHSLLREGTPSADREVQRVLAKRRKRRSYERGVKTAFSRSNSLASFRSEPVYKKRWSTDFSESGNSDFSEDERGMSKLRFDKDGILLNRKTRSVSRIINKSDAAYAEYTERSYKCIDGCTLEYEDLTSLTEHKIEEHNLLAKYWCYECYKTKFTSQEDLDKHNNIMHRTLITNCPLCSEEMQNQEELQKHLAEHRIHSVPCNYCDKYFLSGHSCESHIREQHKGRKKRIKRRRPQTILDRIDKEAPNENSAVEEHAGKEAEATFVKLLIQSVPTEEDEKRISEPPTVNAVLNSNVEEDCDQQQQVNETAPAIEDEEKTSETEGNSRCDVEEMEEEEEEICVTALEETFVATVQEISITYREVCPTQEEENEDTNSVEMIEEEHVDISDICHEEIVTDNSEYLEAPEPGDRLETDHQTTETRDFQRSNRRNLAASNPLIMSPSKNCDVEKHNPQITYVVSISDQNKINSQLSTSVTSNKLGKQKKTRRKSLAKEVKSEEKSAPDRPQLKIVLERLKIGNEFLQDLLGKSPANNSAPSTSLASKRNPADAMKQKRLKKVTASVKTPVHYRGKVYREKPQASKNLNFESKVLNDKLDVYDFKDEDDDKLAKKSLHHKTRSKSANFFKGGEDNARVKTNLAESDYAKEKCRTSTKVRRMSTTPNSYTKSKGKKI